MPAETIPRQLRRVGAVLISAAAVSAVGAALQMRALQAVYGTICGSGGGELAHCPACYAAVALLLSGLACVAASVRRPAPRSFDGG